MAMSTGTQQVQPVDAHQLAAVVRNRIENVLILDTRSFLDFNTCHVIGSINICCSKIIKRRLQQDKVTAKELLAHSCQHEVDENSDVVVYDHSSQSHQPCSSDSFTSVMVQKLLPIFRSVNFLIGGFVDFQSAYPNLCEDKALKRNPLTSLSQPCLATTNQGPTRILPFLYLGSQHDALNNDLLNYHNIIYELNVSTSCPKPDHIQDTHFLRIPVNDNYSEKLLPHFPKAFQFLDKIRKSSGGNVLVHCLAGISRSATIAIAYIMQHLKMTSDDAYRYVKSKRLTISPNFNFLGQLLEYEKQLRQQKILDGPFEPVSAPVTGNDQKRVCRTDMRSGRPTLNLPLTHLNSNSSGATGDLSPSTALAKLSFGGEDSQPNYEATQNVISHSMSCNQKWLSCKENVQVGNSYRESEQIVPATILTKVVLKSSCQVDKKVAIVPHLIETMHAMEDTASELNVQSLNRSRENSELQMSSVKNLDSAGYTNFLHSSNLENTVLMPQGNVYTMQTYSLNNINHNPILFEKLKYTSLDTSTKWSCDLQSPVSETRVEFEIPQFQRSDSVCTSGVSSEGSFDFQCIGLLDDNCEECHVNNAGSSVLKLAAPETKLSSGSFSLPVKKCTEENDYSVVVDPHSSPLSPSECHLLEDVPDEAINSPQSLESFPTWSQQRSTSTKDEKPKLTYTSNPQHETCRKRKSQQWDEPPVKEEHPTESLLSSTKLLLHDSTISVGSEHMLSPNRDGLYRAQSCPGIPSWFALGSATSCRAEVEANMYGNENNEDCNFKSRNCNSLDMLEYLGYKNTIHGSDSCKSCPEATSTRQETLSTSPRIFQHGDLIRVS